MNTQTPPYEVSLPHPVVHCCYHKVGTLWFKRIFRNLSRRYGLSLAVHNRGGHDNPDVNPPIEESDLYFDAHSRVTFDPAVELRGSHMIRDPRDVVISGYKYHIWTEETWVHRPSKRWRGLTYQEHLNSLDEEEGLAEEMRRMAGTLLPRMAAWDFSDERFFEIRYEEIMGREPAVLRDLFTHYGWPSDHLDEVVAFADGFSFQKVVQRTPGAGEAQHHLRSGQSGQWRDVFTPGLVDLARELMTDVLIATGYETSRDW